MVSITTRRTSRIVLALAATAALGACNDSTTVARAPVVSPVSSGVTGQTTRIAALVCSAQISLRTVSCAPQDSSGASRDVIVGGQNQFVKLTSSNVGYTAGVFSFDVTIQNLIPQPMGTSDGTTPDVNGVRAFFASGPTVTSGTGPVIVANADGTATFTASNQPYFAYTGAALGGDNILTSNETSSSKTWRLIAPITATAFTFLVYVSTTVPHPMGFVAMSEDSNFVVTGQTHAITASVRSFVGNAVSGAPAITWGSSNSGVATVDGSGTVTAVAPGTVTITATSDTLVGRTSLQICPDMSTVGASFLVSAASASSVCVAGAGGAAAEYVAVPYNGTTAGSATFAFTGAGIQAVVGPPTPNLVPTGMRSDAMFGVSSSNGLGAAHMALQSQLRRGLPSLSTIPRGRAIYAADHIRSTSARGGARWSTSDFGASNAAGASGPSRSITPGVSPNVGDAMILDVDQVCTGIPDNRTGTVVSKAGHAIIVADDANPAGGFSTAQYDSIAALFDGISYNVIAANFATPTDLDNNGGIVIFFTRAVNERIPNATPSAVTYGFFNEKDLHARNGTAQGCTTSNEGELLYMAVPDPAGSVNGNAIALSTIDSSVVATMTHNLEHLTNVTTRAIIVQTTTPEAVWLDEGLADISTELTFYAVTPLAPRTNLQLADITGVTGAVGAFNIFVAPNFRNLGLWLQQPDSTGAFLHSVSTDLAPTASLAARGALWAFLRYAADRVGGTESSFWAALMNTSNQGMANLQTVIGADPLVWARDFSTAMYTDDAVAGVAAQFTNPSWNYRSVYSGLGLGGFPLLVRSLTNNATLSLPTNFGGASYLRFGVATAAFGTLKTTVDGTTPPSSFGMTIVRTK